MLLGITGAEGLIGWHLRVLLKTRGLNDVRLATRATFAEPDRLPAFVSGVDAIVHLAGMNRGTDAEVESVNVRLAQALTAALSTTGSTAHIVFANSIHVDSDSAYGRGKRAAAAVLQQWARKTGT